MRRRLALFTRLALLALLPLAASAGPAPAGAYDPARLRWSALEFSASKLLMTARASMAAGIVDRAAVAAELRTTPVGAPVAPGERVLQVRYTMSGLGRDSQTLLYADPVTGGALQRAQLDEGRRQRERIYRFTDIGAYHYTRWPATRAEESRPPEAWTKLEEGLRPYPQAAAGEPVTEVSALLWLAAAADLEKAGDTVEVLAFSRRHVHRVIMQVAGTRTVSVDYKEQGPGGTVQRRGRTEALLVRLHGAPLDPAQADADDFELLGLGGDLELLLEPATRAPLELRGRVRIMGSVTVRLRRAVLR
jgi:hypothetical protein